MVLDGGADDVDLTDVRLTGAGPGGLDDHRSPAEPTASSSGPTWPACGWPGAVLRQVEVRDARLTGADLTEARLTGVRLRRCRLDSVVLADAHLRDVRFEDCVLTDAFLGGARLERVAFVALRPGPRRPRRQPARQGRPAVVATCPRWPGCGALRGAVVDQAQVHGDGHPAGPSRSASSCGPTGARSPTTPGDGPAGSRLGPIGW